ncbi:MAG TPA: translocation/assembly module TamB domain-containing protein, partial [Blastocatellia bacterium]|nr:translocation/assembly module TamB domain-containing protein [Blastocatellia bacterium]
NITGRVEVEGGTIKFRSERFDIDTGTLDFLGSGETPTVNVLTEGDVSSYHCYVGLQGPIDDMDVTLRSDPELPRSEILSLVATGKTSSDTIGGQQMVESGLGTAGSLLSSTFISQPAQSLLGLNRFEIDPVLQPNANPAARITIGRQLTHDLSFTYSTNVTAQQDQSAIAEYTLSNRLSGVASYTQGGNVINGARTDSSFSIEVRRRSSYSLGYGEAPATGAAPAGKGVPTRPVKAALPRADVQIENPAGIKLSGRKLEELLPVKKEGFSRALGRLGLSNLTNYLQEQGYFFAKVTQRCDPADCTGSSVRLIYDVQPGERYDLEQIRLDGTKVIELDDVSGLRSRAASFLGGIPLLRSLPLIGGSARGITSDDRILDDRNTIRGRLAELGYRSAKVTSQINRKPESQEMTLVFHVDTGPQSLVSQVEFSGNTILSSPELMRALPIKGGAPFSPSVARSGAQAIKSQYAAHGYLDTKAQYRLVDVGKDRVGVVYSILEGERAVVSDVAITGQTRTNEGSIRRFLAFKNGDLLTPSLIRQSQRALYATGAFSEVNIRNEQSSKTDAAARRVTVQVTEARPLLFVYGAGYSTDEGPRGLLQISDSNLFGKVNSASFRVRASRREQLFQTQFTDLRPFGSQWALTLSAFYDRNTDLTTLVQRKLVGGGTSTNTGPGFGIDRLAAFIQTERKLSAITAIHFRYTFENTKLSNVQNIPVEEIPRNVQAIRLGMLSAGFTQDTRDSALNPTKGRLLSLEHSIALRPLGGSEAYNKFFLNYQRYHTLPVNTPFFRDSVLAFSGRLGLSAPFSLRGTGPGGTITEPDTELPISERFFAGGATTLRGFGFDQAGPQGVLEPRNAQELPTLVPIGGDALVILNFELRYPLTKQLRLVPFYDLGNVFPHVSDLGWKGM